nr:MAG: wsv325-like protein [Hemigrapsus takanoi nimavirus]
MVFVLLDIRRKINQEASVTSSSSLHDESVRYVSGANRKTVARFRRDLVANPSGTTITSSNTSPSKNAAITSRFPRRRKKLFHLLRDGGESKSISNIYKQIMSSIRDIELYYDRNRLPKVLFDKLEADPYINTAVVLSKYAKLFSPMHAKSTWSTEQLNGRLVTPDIVTGNLDRLESGTSTALVLPSGYVVNKARRMTKEDREALYLVGYTPECSEADIASRINLFGYNNAHRNEEALASHCGNIELLLCPCANHKDELQEPYEDTYSQNVDEIQVSIDKK